MKRHGPENKKLDDKPKNASTKLYEMQINQNEIIRTLHPETLRN